MCMEDIRLGRKTVFKFHTESLGVTPVQLVPYNAKRIAIGFSTATAAGIMYVGQSDTALTEVGLMINGAGGATVLDIQKHGSICFGPFYLSSTAVLTAFWFEVLLQDE